MSKKIPIIYNSLHLDHRPCRLFGVDPHPDQADRIENIILEIKKADIGKIIKPQIFNPKIIYKVHDKDYLNFLQSFEKRLTQNYYFPTDFYHDSQIKLNNFHALLGKYSLDVDTPVTQNTYKLALNSVNIALTGAKLLSQGEKIVYCACRPPGHHAMKNMIAGFCYLNNVAISSEYLLKFGKIAILDIDYHHGNGTENIFNNRSYVLTISLHINPKYKFPFYWGFKSESDNNLNIPLKPGTNEKQYSSAINKALKKIKTFNPKYLVIAFGVDTYKKDILGNFKLSTEYYQVIGKKISNLNIPTLIIQEGGYHKDIGKNVVSFLNGFIT